MAVSNLVKNINPSQTLAITAQALKMKQEGKKLLVLEQVNRILIPPKILEKRQFPRLKKVSVIILQVQELLNLKEQL